MTAVITGIGWVSSTSMGCGTDHDHVSMKKGPLPDIKRKMVLAKPAKAFGRMDRFSKTGLAAISFALKDACLETWDKKRDIGIIASTTYGCLDTDIRYFDTVIPEQGLLASPGLFAYTLSNCFLGEAAIYFGLTGAGYIINEMLPGGMYSLQTALRILVSGENDIMVCGFCDLGNPIPLDNETGTDDTVSGALFFVIEKIPGKSCKTYGTLRMEENSRIFLNETAIDNWCMLADTCFKKNDAFKA